VNIIAFHRKLTLKIYGKRFALASLAKQHKQYHANTNTNDYLTLDITITLTLTLARLVVAWH